MGRPVSNGVLGVGLGKCGKRMREALERDQRGCAGRMCCREKRRSRERAVNREEDRFTDPEIV